MRAPDYSNSPEVHYHDYLALDEILNAQHPESNKYNSSAHDEMLFIIIHQAYELWFKQLHHEADSIVQIMKKPALNDNSPELQTVVHRLNRMVVILRVLVHQIDILETMTPMDFLDFRDELFPASGFQSVQFRLIENKLGMRRGDRLQINDAPYTSRFSREDAGREGFDRVARSYPTLPDVTAPGAVAGGAAAPTKESETERAAHVASLIAAWRAAILQRDADMVVQLDLTFRETPDRYAAALLENARTDSNERVRAFSTRTLGKLGRANLAPSFGQLLADASPYVRQNAAWALGELASVPEGRAATRSTLAELRRARSRDPANDVRSAARDALTRLE